MPKIHSLKILRQYYRKIVSGEKKFELRKNDRNFQEGDLLQLLETDSNGHYTDDWIVVEVTYMLEDFPGIETGYCIMGIEIKK